jgi:hypothetical protein
MYTKELIPQAIAMGVSYNDFWHLTMRSYNAISEGYKLKREIEDENNWILGGYICDAVGIAIGNAFRGKGQKASDYFEIIDKPFLREKKPLTEDEIQAQRQLVLEKLRTMKTNFDLSHGK